jgi:Lar family restriction alleviation protein
MALKPCPFCCSDNINGVFDMKDPQENREMFIQCSDCGARGSSYYGVDNYTGSEIPAEVVELWNRRVTLVNPKEDMSNDNNKQE